MTNKTEIQGNAEAFDERAEKLEVLKEEYARVTDVLAERANFWKTLEKKLEKNLDKIKVYSEKKEKALIEYSQVECKEIRTRFYKNAGEFIREEVAKEEKRREDPIYVLSHRCNMPERVVKDYDDLYFVTPKYPTPREVGEIIEQFFMKYLSESKDDALKRNGLGRINSKGGELIGLLEDSFWRMAYKNMEKEIETFRQKKKQSIENSNDSDLENYISDLKVMLRCYSVNPDNLDKKEEGR